jgi:hypothetical protein
MPNRYALLMEYLLEGLIAYDELLIVLVLEVVELS